MSSNAEALAGANPDEIEAKMRELGENLATLNAAASLLENLRKTMHARIAYEAGDDVKSEAARERFASASEKYEDHVIQMVDARERADKARAQLESYRVFVEMKRTLAATERAMMQIR